jgi:hypothetical protein
VKLISDNEDAGLLVLSPEYFTYLPTTHVGVHTHRESSVTCPNVTYISFVSDGITTETYSWAQRKTWLKPPARTIMPCGGEQCSTNAEGICESQTSTSRHATERCEDKCVVAAYTVDVFYQQPTTTKDMCAFEPVSVVPLSLNVEGIYEIHKNGLDRH